MRVLFYQPNYQGHHFAYLARMLPGFIKLPIEIVVATVPQAIESEEFRKTLSPLSDSIKFATCCTTAPRRPLSNAWHRLRGLIHAINVTQPDHVIVSYADGIWDLACAQTICGRRPWPRDLVVEGCIYRGRFGDMVDTRKKSELRRWLFKRLLSLGLFHRLYLHHELLYQFAMQSAEASPTSVVLAPDPIILRPEIQAEEARRELGINGFGPWIGVIGVIAKFKGADLFLDAYQKYRAQHPQAPARALLAGPHADEIRAMLLSPPYCNWVNEGSLVSIDRFLSESEMFAAAAALDVVVTPYPNHQNRSSIILWAAAAGRRSLGTNSSCISYVIKNEGLGLTSEVLDTTALADSIAAALNMPWTASDAERVRRYAEFHRCENYQQISSETVRQRLKTH